MATNINSAVIAGNLTKDPFINDAETVAKFSIANNRGYGDKQFVNYIDVVSFNGQVQFVKNNLRKGSAIVLTGELKQDVWEKDGQKQSKLYIVADEINFAGTRSSGVENEQLTPSRKQTAKSEKPTRLADPKPSANNDEDNTIPF